MRTMLFALAIVSSGAALISSPAAAANAPSFPIKLAHENFSYAPEQLPPGCKLVSSYTDKGVSGKITCETKAQWEAGFTVGGDMQADCPEDDSKTPYVCIVHKNRS